MTGVGVIGKTGKTGWKIILKRKETAAVGKVKPSL
jgi:hypothetical protein